MNIHEYQAKALCKEFGIKTADGLLALTSLEAVNNAKKLGGEIWAIKAQIHAGGRGLGGGVKIAKSLNEVKHYAKDMIKMTLITPQTGKNGKVVNKIYIEKGCKIKKEFYLSISFNRDSQKLCLIASSSGGMSIEEISSSNPELIKAIFIDPQIGLMDFHILEISSFLGFDKDKYTKFHDILTKIYDLYMQKDAVLIETNPLILDEDDEFLVLDAKMSFDDSALFRHPEILALRDLDEEDNAEIEAKKHSLSYVKLDGNIGCMVNGAGLAMGTMDAINFAGGKPANFLDVGGLASSHTVAKAFEIILKDEFVKVIFINIFGGIVRCDRIANGIIEAINLINPKIPIVIRLDGTNAKEAEDILKKANILNLIPVKNLEDGAILSVKLSKEFNKDIK